MATASPSTRRASAGTKDRPASRSWVRWGPAPPRKTRAPRLPVQAIYKFDDRRIVAGRIESGHLAAGDEIVIMPAGKIAKIKSVESWPGSRLFGRHHARPRAVHRARRHHRAYGRHPARHAAVSRTDFLAA